MPKESFADRLRAAMEKQNMKQVDLVRAAASAGGDPGQPHCGHCDHFNCVADQSVTGDSGAAAAQERCTGGTINKLPQAYACGILSVTMR